MFSYIMHYVNGCYINVLIMYVLNNVSLLASKRLVCIQDVPAPAPVKIFYHFSTEVSFMSFDDPDSGEFRNVFTVH